MAWLRIALTEEEQRIVLDERESHTDACVRRRLWVLWLLHCGLKREQAAKIVGVGVSSVQRDVSLYRRSGLEALRTSEREYQPTSELARHQDQIRKSLEQQPARTIAEACQRIKDLTGVERRPTQRTPLWAGHTGVPLFVVWRNCESVEHHLESRSDQRRCIGSHFRHFWRISRLLS